MSDASRFGLTPAMLERLRESIPPLRAPRTMAQMLDDMTEDERTAVANSIVEGRDATPRERELILTALRRYDPSKPPYVGGVFAPDAARNVFEAPNETILPLRDVSADYVFDSTLPLVIVAECFRCANKTTDDAQIGAACQRDGCDGRYVRT